jgi:RNA polymerase sigma-70 factor (ECF subfamily)
MPIRLADSDRPNDDQTVVPFRTQEGRALAQTVYDRHDSELRNYLRKRLAAAADVDDVIQEIYLRIARYPTPDAILNTQAFVMTIAANLLRDRFAMAVRRRHDLQVPYDEAALPCRRPSLELQLEAEQTLAIVLAALSELKPKTRDALILHRFRNLTYPQIAERMGLSTSMVQKHINQALVHITRKLKIES